MRVVQTIYKKSLGADVVVEYSGNTVFGNGEVVTGRICDSNNARSEALSGGARIVWWNGVDRVSELVMRTAVGLIAPAEYAWRACAIALAYAVPVMCMTVTAVSSTAFIGAVAILDTAKQRLYVDPDVDMISSVLVGDMARAPRRLTRLAMTDSTLLPESFDGLVMDCNGEDADAEYRRLCDVSDANTGARIVATVRFDGGSAEFCRRVSNVFRAGVWGRFSLLCSGVYTPSGWRACALAIHSVFRELDVSGREFNGFIPRGIVIDTPRLLLDVVLMGELDLYCFDVDALIRRFCGPRADAEGERLIYAHIKELCRHQESARAALMLRREAHSALCESLCERSGGFEIYQEVKNIQKK